MLILFTVNNAALIEKAMTGISPPTFTLRKLFQRGVSEERRRQSRICPPNGESRVETRSDSEYERDGKMAGKANVGFFTYQ